MSDSREGKRAMISAGTGSRRAAVVLSAAVLVMAPTAAYSDPPAFPTTLSQGTSCQVWDIAGTMTYVEDVPDVGNLTLTFVVATDDKGRIAGTGALDAAIFVPGFDTFVIDLDDPLAKGKVKSSPGGPAQLQLQSKLTGTTSGAGLSLPTTGSVKIKGEIDAQGSFQGTGTLKLKLLGQSSKSSGPIALDVTPDPANDGSWDLNVVVASADGVTLTGIGDAVLATGRVVDNLEVKGKYSVKKDLSNLNLKNVTGAKVLFKNLEADATSNTYTGGSMKYSILGQKNAVSVTGCP